MKTVRWSTLAAAIASSVCLLWGTSCARPTNPSETKRDLGTRDPEPRAPNLEPTAVTPAGSDEALCPAPNERTSSTLSCDNGQVIATVSVASDATATAPCPSASDGTCPAETAQREIEATCLSRTSCVLPVHAAVSGDPCAGAAPKLTVTHTCKSIMPVFLLAGQSNMEGNTDPELHDGLMDDLARDTEAVQMARMWNRLDTWYREYNNGYARYGYSQERVKLEVDELIRLHRDGLVGEHLAEPMEDVLCSWTTAIAPLALNCGKPYGPELMLGRLLAKASYAPTSLIKVAKGGTLLYTDWVSKSAAIHTGRPIGKYYQQLVRQINALWDDPASIHPNCASQECQWAGFIWFQGENDSFDPDPAQAYEANLKDFLADVRDQVGHPTLPVIVIEMGAWAQSLDFGPTVVNAQRAVVAADPHARLVKTDDLSGFFHYDPAAQLIIGERVGNTLLKMLPAR